MKRLSLFLLCLMMLLDMVILLNELLNIPTF